MGLKYRNILVAIDGSKEADWAFQKGIEIAKRNGARMILVHVIDTRSFALIEAYDTVIGDRAEKLAKDMLEKYQQQAVEAGLTNVQYEIEYGSPKIRIPRDIAKKHHVDLILCGATGMNVVERFIIGSVSEHITRYAPCDVLVVRTIKDAE
ncbi:universal stress protein UspA [Bacillus sp. AFS076308]|uniref:universal stress protein n=1 Tax=unclassified Bacillus (in: firmicutes) TaxID=185979 RepID=UPI000BF26654|nr:MULTISPECIES: universal stress protein [unclassified Bacillus (in: firmicutes)]PFN75235.1 universal stress protein UspA [Bacillus sp. AFS076308]PGV45050.1 universal stress protein UspA [Bacillus sp. AFS037270]